jgi:hypothetical protein
MGFQGIPLIKSSPAPVFSIDTCRRRDGEAPTLKIKHDVVHRPSRNEGTRRRSLASSGGCSTRALTAGGQCGARTRGAPVATASLELEDEAELLSSQRRVDQQGVQSRDRFAETVCKIQYVSVLRSSRRVCIRKRGRIHIRGRM